MKRIYVNFKRFDVPVELGGINRFAASMADWAKNIVCGVQEPLTAYSGAAQFIFFFPEAHLITAAMAKSNGSPVRLGCQGVFREDVAPDGNFGAFTTNRPAAAAKALGCEAVLVGHCEERSSVLGVLAEASCGDSTTINRILNKEVLCAAGRGLDVLYCVGETAEEQENWESVLRLQLRDGLAGVERERIAIAYEPVWAIGLGKTPPDANYIQKVARYIKKETDNLPVVYGGGLKAENAAMLAGIPEIDGGLIALTRFSDAIGFYPDEYLQIVQLYLEK